MEVCQRADAQTDAFLARRRLACRLRAEALAVHHNVDIKQFAGILVPCSALAGLQLRFVVIMSTNSPTCGPNEACFTDHIDRVYAMAMYDVDLALAIALSMSIEPPALRVKQTLSMSMEPPALRVQTGL